MKNPVTQARGITGKWMTLLATCSLLTACGAARSLEEHRDPQHSDMSVTADSFPEAASITVPVPVRPAAPAPKRAESASLWQRDHTGFFGDRRAGDVGDILTITIRIDDEARLRNQSERSRGSGVELGAPTILGYEGKIDRILPGINADDLPAGPLVDLSGNSSSRGEGSINRQERISLKVAAMVIQKLENGNLVVAGRQEVKVNNELRELRVAGIIRPVDIGMDNSIPYDRIAEARITYGGRGQISRVQQPRYGEDVLDVILPY